MVIILDYYKISPYGDYCYRLARRKGKKQWRTLGYYDHLADATEFMFDHYVRTSQDFLRLDAGIASVRKEVNRLVETMHCCCEELKEVVKNIERIK